ncbi:MBL fold metallo-hydrolase [Cronobacter turicensis]|uniref:MBL fold metallo-hydrolase n=1 Tax=Cronobacter turicensis TaxID=413502 RepID=UPI001E00C358|nr:ribonuclease Z [Cronobacter turicensis]EGT5680092.1 ribonuclease Z [Cronobacter turicensis]EGT5740501.1 ribonuclease Z [Cronobacter turicensis]ELY6318506.1 ribonuclease Z [Cronobacter turicensis]MDI6432588.1 ribonuclease Z [Cronobacter turicensis]
MIIDVLGSGSAFATQQNTSAILIKGDGQWLVDCGPTIPRALWQRQTDINAIDVIWFTHVHPDHCAGLAPLLNQWKSVGRVKPLTIYCQPDQRTVLQQQALLAVWPQTTFCFAIDWRDITGDMAWRDWRIRSAPTQHEIPCRALRIDADGAALFYSGDGRPTPDSLALMAGATLAFQECASWQALDDDASHGDFPSCLTVYECLRLPALGLYHCREADIPAIRDACARHPALFFVEEGQQYTLARP